MMVGYVIKHGISHVLIRGSDKAWHQHSAKAALELLYL
jgi:hypothetical protein